MGNWDAANLLIPRADKASFLAMSDATALPLAGKAELRRKFSLSPGEAVW
jgi:hypothetical protein